MVITEFLERNAKDFAEDTALVEINPQVMNETRMTWKEYSLMQPNSEESGRVELTWSEFDKKANRFANLLLSRGIKKGDRRVRYGNSFASISLSRSKKIPEW